MRWILPNDRLPSAWFNVAPHLDEPLQPPLAPGDQAAGGARRPGAAVPDGAHRPGDVSRAVDRRAGRGARHLAAVAADPAGPGPPAGAGAGHAGPHLLQGRVGVARGVAQAQYRGAPGVLQQGRGRQPADHRDRRRSVGERAGVRHVAVRPGVQGLHGPGVVPAEALPAGDDGDLGRDGGAVAGRRPEPSRVAGHRHQRCRAGRGRPIRHPLLTGLGAQPRAAAPDRDRFGGQGAAGSWRARRSPTS